MYQFNRIQRTALSVALGAIVLGVSALGGVMLTHAAPSAANCRTFPETGHSVCDKFLTYWDSHGGLAQQGYPISETFTENSPLDGKPYTVQYFERAVFELHPENQPPYDVLLSQLGTIVSKQKYIQGFPAAGGVPFYEDRTDPVTFMES
ncbi:MAG: peptidase S8, partial [Chloroflexota bacterium]